MHNLTLIYTGWHQTCTITSGIGRIELATWAYYIQPNFEEQMQRRLKHASLASGLDFEGCSGVDAYKLQCHFETSPDPTLRIVLFLTYRNITNYLVGVRKDDKWVHLEYPRFDLCSIDYLGYKMLAPCNPKEIIEIGKTKNINSQKE